METDGFIILGTYLVLCGAIRIKRRCVTLKAICGEACSVKI